MISTHGHIHTDKKRSNTNKIQRRKGWYEHIGHFEGIVERSGVRDTRAWNTKKGPTR